MKLLMLLGGVLILVGVQYGMSRVLKSPEQVDPVPEVAASLPAIDPQQLVLRGGASDYRIITDKALFNEERRVETLRPRARPAPAPVRDERLELLALGIAVSDEGFLAVVKDKRKGAIIRMRLNERFNGWELQAISPDGFTYNKAGREAFIPFKLKEAGHE